MGILLVRCSKDDAPITSVPIVSFSYSGANVSAPAAVFFTNNSYYATSYVWDFGDNQTSTLQNPIHTYTSGGVYTVELTAFGAGGMSSSSKTININNPPTSVKINKLTLTAMPFINSSGTGWDPSDGPDVFYNITDVNNIVLSGPSATSNNLIQSGLPITWTYSTPYVINNFSKAIYFDFWDYDTLDPNDYINFVGFLMSNYTSGTNPYPTTITETKNGITVTLNVTWL